MLHSLVVGLGRAGGGLHLPVLRQARRRRPELFAAAPLVGVDPLVGLAPPDDADDPPFARPAPTARPGQPMPSAPPPTSFRRGLHHTGGPQVEPPHAASRSADRPSAARPVPAAVPPPAADLRLLPDLRDPSRLPPPDTTVAHVCTPPLGRVGVVARLLELGYRRLVVEKPLAADPAALAALVRLVRAADAQVAVVAPWLASTLTDRLTELASEPERHRLGLGALRRVSVLQHKPRFRRSLLTHGHPTAFDIEVPHALGVLLTLAGDAEVVSARCTDLVVGGQVLPALGSARLRLLHHGGVRSEIRSDLGSPVRERRITLHFEHATAIGHYPGAADDEYAQLRLRRRDRADPTDRTAAERLSRHEVFPDDALTRFMLRSYAAFAARADLSDDFACHVRAVDLLGRAKELSGVARSDGPAPDGWAGESALAQPAGAPER